MAKDVVFNIRLQVDGKEKIVSATAVSKHLADSFDEVRNASNHLRNAFFDMNQWASLYVMSKCYRRAAAFLNDLRWNCASAFNARYTLSAGSRLSSLL